MTDRLVLQRQLPGGDCRRWRSVLRFSEPDAPKVQRAVQALAEVDQVLWRVVTDDDQQREVGRLVGKVWQIDG